MSVIINGRHIQGSPYSVMCRKYLALNVPSKRVNDDGRMGEPWGIAFGKDGMWAVANHCVYLFDSQDQVVKIVCVCVCVCVYVCVRVCVSIYVHLCVLFVFVLCI